MSLALFSISIKASQLVFNNENITYYVHVPYTSKWFFLRQKNNNEKLYLKGSFADPIEDV